MVSAGDEPAHTVTDIAIYLAVIFVGGGLAHFVKLPPLVGFLGAGFVLGTMDMPYVDEVGLLADLGVTLLLFTIGLKLDIGTIVKREVWLTSWLHMLFTIVVSMLFLGIVAGVGVSLLAGTDLATIALLGFGLSFSSTVFVVKVLEERSEAQSLYGRIAIGVLVMQDIAAVIFMTFVSGKTPSIYALSLVLLWPLMRLARLALPKVGHGELLVVFGVLLALVPGYAWFSAVGLKGDLGALIVGVMLASHPSSKELARSLFSVKELLLVAFFVSIGLLGTPSGTNVILAAALLLLIPIKVLGFGALLWLARLRGRTIGAASTALGNYSEFGLIVVALGVDAALLDSEWLTTFAVAVSLSFVLSAVANRRESSLPDFVGSLFPRHRPQNLHVEERPIDIAGAHAVVLGMGRVGMAAYDRLESRYGLSVVGIETSLRRVEEMRGEGRCVVEADATDRSFWERITSIDTIEVAVLAMPFHGANQVAIRRLNASGFSGHVVAVAKYDDDVQPLFDAGADDVVQLYDGAGSSVADRGAAAASLVADTDNPPGV